MIPARIDSVRLPGKLMMDFLEGNIPKKIEVLYLKIK